MQRPSAVAFDVIGTLFSLEPLRAILGNAGVPGDNAVEVLFAETLRDAFALAATGAFQPLPAVLGASLDTVFHRAGIPALAAAVQKRIALAAMEELPAYPDAGDALTAVAAAGIPVLALSNGGASATEALLRRSGLRESVAHVVSVDEVGLAKPRREVYLYAASRAGVAPGRLALVAAHPWDVQGAKAAGLTAGFVARGQAFPPTMAKPDAEGDTLAAVAGQLARL